MPPDSEGGRPALPGETSALDSAKSGKSEDLLKVIEQVLRAPSLEKREEIAAVLAALRVDVNIGGVEGLLELARAQQKHESERGDREDDRLDRAQWMAFGLVVFALACGVVAVLAGAYLAAKEADKFAIAAFVIGAALLGGTAATRIGGLFMQARKMFSASRDSKNG